MSADPDPHDAHEYDDHEEGERQREALHVSEVAGAAGLAHYDGMVTGFASDVGQTSGFVGGGCSDVWSGVVVGVHFSHMLRG